MAKFNIDTVILVLVGLVVLFIAVAEIMPLAQSSGDDLNESNQCNTQGNFFNHSSSVCQAEVNVSTPAASFGAIPLAGLFAGDGVIFLLFMAFVILVVIVAVNLKKRQ